MQQDKIAETLAINSGNMIASLNLQVAQLQVAHKQLEEENDKLKIEIAELKKGNRKVVRMNESSDNHTADKQKH